MKNLVLVAFVCVLCQSLAIGQQVNIGPESTNEHVFVKSILPLGGVADDVLLFGSGRFDNSVSIRMSLTGDVAWSSASDNLGSFNSSALMPDGTIVVVGWGADSYVALLEPNGNVLWNKFMYTPDTLMRFDAVATDQSGNIYVAGRKGAGSGNVSRDVLIKLDQDGDVLYERETIMLSNPGNERDIHVRGDSVFIVSSVQNNSGDIGLGVYSASSGNLLIYRVFGSFSNEAFLNAAFGDAGIFFTYGSQGTGVSVGRIRWSTLTLAQDPVFIFPLGGEALNTGQISVRGQDVYISGGVGGVGYNASFVVKLSHNLSILWGRLLTILPPSLVTFGTSSAVLPNGDVLFIDLVTQPDFSVVTRLTGLSSAGNPNGTYCNSPSNFQVMGVNDGAFLQGSLTRVQTNLNPLELIDSFSPYFPSAENCNLSVLPVELVSFLAHKSGKVVTLDWSTGSESGTSHFDILRSQDANDWVSVGQVAAVGESHSAVEYSFVDDEPLVGVNYYKLRSVDYDGSSQDSEVRVVDFGSSRNFTVYPNPALVGERITVKGEFVLVEAFDQLGRRVRVQTSGNQLSVQSGPGVYLLSFTDVKGLVETVRVVIN